MLSSADETVGTRVVGCPARSSATLDHLVFDRIAQVWTAAGVEPTYLEAMRSAFLPKRPRLKSALGAPLPLLSLPGLCCEAAGGAEQRADVVAAAWLLFYTAAHLLDSVADGDMARKAGSYGGGGTTINIATGLLASANLTLNMLEECGSSPEAACAMRGDFYRAMLKACSGQHGDLTLLNPTIEQCWEIAEAKSGAVFALACRAGARLAISDVDRVDLFSQFGHHLGILIQIGDDISGLWSTEFVSSDLLAGQRWTLPIAYALEASPPVLRERLAAYLLAAPTDHHSEAKARCQILESGALLYLAVEARRHYSQAWEALAQAEIPSLTRDRLQMVLHRAIPLSISI